MRKRRIPEEVELEVFKRDNFTCQYCGFVGDTFEKWVFLQTDHFVPKSKGGSDDVNNLITSCISCNMMKQAMSFDTIEEARKAIQKWRGEMRSYYDKEILGKP